MLRFAILLLVLLATVPICAQTDIAIKQKLQSENYSTTWRTVREFPAESLLEIGYGSGHGGTLGWIRFVPTSSDVQVISIEIDEGWNPYNSKWAPDVAPVKTEIGVMTGDSYRGLLHRLAVVDSARLRPIERNSIRSTSANFWSSVKLSDGMGRTLIDTDWAGYWSSAEESEFAKLRLSIELARAVVAEIDLVEGPLTRDQRSWASRKFIEDFGKFTYLDFYWWVAERLIILIGPIADETVLPTLLGILATAPAADDPSANRRVYYAINAITRITGRDLRPRPVEEMDIDSTRKRYLAVFKNSRAS